MCTPHLAKGLEFDRVVIADASDAVFATEMDRNLLYVACTRMHVLTLVSPGATSRHISGIGDGDGAVNSDGAVLRGTAPSA